MRRETSDKNTTQKQLHSRERLKRKTQGHVIDVDYRPGKRKSKRGPKSPQKNPPCRNIGFMHKRTEKAKKQREEQKSEVVYLSTQPEHPRDRFRRKAKDGLKEEAENEVVH